MHLFTKQLGNKIFENVQLGKYRKIVTIYVSNTLLKTL